MTIARSQAAVPWVPSRHRFALFRLIAYVRLLRTRHEQMHPATGADRIVLAVDPDQSTAEAYTVAILVLLTVASFFAALLSARLVLAAAILIALPLAMLAFSAAMVLVGLVVTALRHAVGAPRAPSNITVNSTVMLTGVTLAASYFATWQSWVRIPSWIFLGALVLNTACSAVLFVLRNRVRAAELRCAV